jgi:hypothetical protein
MMTGSSAILFVCGKRIDSDSGREPPASQRLDVARARVRVLWKRHPQLTGKQVRVSLGLKHQHLLGVYRARQLLKEYRVAAATHCSVHKKAGWWLPSSRSADCYV